MVSFGYIVIFIGLVLSAYAALASLVAARREDPTLMESARNAVYAVAALTTIAFLLLLYFLVTRHFEIEYVASYTSRDLPLLYTISAAWAGQKGSLLLWAWVLSLYGGIVIWQNRDKNRHLMPYVTAVLMAIQTFFLFILNFVTPPFATLPTPPPDGHGLNPLLQNHLMLFHPPTTYIGYVGFAVPFAFAIAALITGRLGDLWIASTRRWTLWAWFWLSIGIIAGAQWAYVELGWGGYWAWDPVENAELMPWLTGTAFLHSVMIQERRGMLKVWNMVLIIITFLLTIFGTLLVRSGILQSVHAFGESTLGAYFIAFILVTALVSFRYLALRLPDLRGENEFDSFISRESTFLLNNLILVGSAFSIFWGTVYPLVSEAVRGIRVTVGPPFFNQVNVPIFFVLLLIIGICPLIGWARASSDNLIRNFLKPFIAAEVLTGLLFVLGVRRIGPLIFFSVCAFVAFTIFLELYRGTRALHRTRNIGHLSAFSRLIWGNKRRYGGYLVHLGIIMMAVGITASSAFKVNKQVALKPGESVKLRNYEVKYEDLLYFPTQSKEIIAAEVSVYYDGKKIGDMSPRKEFYRGDEKPTSEVAIRTTIAEDLYLILAGWDKDKTAVLDVIINPLVVWIWIGGYGFLLMGTLIAFWPDAREKKRLALLQAQEG
jgi:cytochrome c-type biogenesis protein CcmF